MDEPKEGRAVVLSLSARSYRPPDPSVDQEVPMALSPCEATGHRFAGKACRAYIAIMCKGNKWEHKPRLCSGHFNALLTIFELVGGEVSSDPNDQKPFNQCLVCHKELDGDELAAVFMTSYGIEGARVDWYAGLHEECEPKAQELIRNP